MKQLLYEGMNFKPEEHLCHRDERGKLFECGI